MRSLWNSQVSVRRAFPIIVGLHHDAPLVMGRKLPERAGRIAFWTGLVGFNIAFLPMLLTGLREPVLTIVLDARPVPAYR